MSTTKTARVMVPAEPITARPGSYMQGLSLPYVSKGGFPVFLFDGDECFVTDAQEQPALPGTVGVDIRGNLHVVDCDGSVWEMGMRIPPALDPQPLEVDEEHPFFAAAKRAQQPAATT